MADMQRRLDKVQAERDQLRHDVNYLIGWYSVIAERPENAGNAELRALLDDLDAVIEGTWTKP